MAGLLVGAIALVWFALSTAVARLVTRRISNRGLRAAATTGIALLLLSAPLVDEIIGYQQFHNLCQEGAQLRVKAVRSKGATVYTDIAPSNEFVAGTSIPILHSHIRLIAVDNNEEVASYDRYVAKGGWLIRLLAISENTSPLIIGLPSCGPFPSWNDIKRTYGLTVDDKQG